MTLGGKIKRQRNNFSGRKVSQGQGSVREDRELQRRKAKVKVTINQAAEEAVDLVVLGQSVTLDKLRELDRDVTLATNMEEGR